MSSAVCVKSWRISLAVSGCVSVAAATASRPADTIRPAMRGAWRVASDEHDVDDTLTATLPPKFVQPSMYSHDAGSTGFVHSPPPGQSLSVLQPLPGLEPPAHSLRPKSRI